LAFLTAGCSLRPIPEDVTRNNTYQIAQRIRCEFREDLRYLLVAGLRDPERSTPASIAAAEALTAGAVDYKDFFDKVLPSIGPPIRTMIERYRKGAIGYEFEFDIEDSDKQDGSLTLTDPLSRGSLTLGLTAKNDRKRHTKRNFSLIDTYEDLIVSGPMARVCAKLGERVEATNGQYPIDGQLNLRELLDTFISLTQSGNLVGRQAPTQDVPTLADTITFTTELTSGVNPKLTLKALGSQAQVTDAGLNMTRGRKDIHKVTIALTLPPSQRPPTIAQLRGRSEQELARAAASAELDRQRQLALFADQVEIKRLLLGR
jgi:hypothetical protein